MRLVVKELQPLRLYPINRMNEFLKRFSFAQYFRILKQAESANKNVNAQKLVSASKFKNSIELAHDVILYEANPIPLLEIRQSSIGKGAGLGVFVNGLIKKGEICSVYPGTVYDTTSYLLLPSIGNHYLFKSFDSILVDGKKTGLSKMLFKSHWKRHRWNALDFTENSLPFFNGQMINNGSEMANCRYQELDLNPRVYDFRNHRKLPNVYHRLDWDPVGDIRRVVLIIATRDIQNEELLSNYNEIIT